MNASSNRFRSAGATAAACADPRDRGSEDAFLHARRRRPRGRRRLVCPRSRRDARDRRRVRLRQVRHRAIHPAPDCAPPGGSSTARSASKDAICSRFLPGDAHHPRQRDLDDLSGADDVAQPGAHDRQADRRDADPASGPVARARAPRGRDAAPGAHSRGRAADRAVSLPALRRDAPARDDRHGAVV